MEIIMWLPGISPVIFLHFAFLAIVIGFYSSTPQAPTLIFIL